MDRSIVSQFNVLISAFIENRIKVEDCKQYLSDFFIYDIDLSNYNISDKDKDLISSIAKNYISRQEQFNDKQINIITNSLVDMAYSSYYYFNISINKGGSFTERQLAKNQYVLRDSLLNTTYSYLVDEGLGMRIKKDYLRFKADFEKYIDHTTNIINIYNATPKDKHRIVKAIEKRLSVANILLSKYNESLGLNKILLTSVIEDDIAEMLRIKKLNSNTCDILVA